MLVPTSSSPETARTIILISCSSRKTKQPAPAAALYRGTVFKASLAWATHRAPKAIYILSAKHHLVEPGQLLEPYDLTLNDMPISELRRWSNTVLQQLRSAADIERDRFVILAGEKYRRYLLPHLKHVELPLEGMRIGEQVQFLQRDVAARDSTQPAAQPAHFTASVSEPADCGTVHRHLAALPRFRFPYDSARIPENGIYILFEAGEHAHGTDRIVRIGTHRGNGQLLARLREHFLTENKDRSIFRKNIGRALLHRDRSPLAAQWEIDLTTREAREKHGPEIDQAAIDQVERRVSDYMRANFSFAVLEVPDKSARLRLEAGLIASVNRCKRCSPSSDWLGHDSPKQRISDSGLWLVQGLGAEPLTRTEWHAIQQSRTDLLARSDPALTEPPPSPQKKPRGQPKGSRNMPKKYAPLEEFLRSSGTDEITLAFKEIEAILGQPLPRSARDHRPWWSNPTDIRSTSQQSAWLNAGYRVASVSLGITGWVRFERARPARPAIALKPPRHD